MKLLFFAFFLFLVGTLNAQSAIPFADFSAEMSRIYANYRSHGDTLFLLHFKEYRSSRNFWEEPFHEKYQPQWWNEAMVHSLKEGRSTKGSLLPFKGFTISIRSESDWVEETKNLDSTTYRLYEVCNNDTTLRYFRNYQGPPEATKRSLTQSHYHPGNPIVSSRSDTVELSPKTYQTAIYGNLGEGWKEEFVTNHRRIIRRGRLKKEIAETVVLGKEPHWLTGADKPTTHLMIRVTHFQKNGLIRKVVVRQKTLEKFCGRRLKICFKPQGWKNGH